MYWVDYYECVNYKEEEKQFKVDAEYKTANKHLEKAAFVDNASDAPALFRAWRKEFKALPNES